MPDGYFYITEDLLQDMQIFDKLVDFFGELKQVKGLEKIQRDEGLVVFSVKHPRIHKEGDLYRIDFEDGEIKKLCRIAIGMDALKVKLRKLEEKDC